VRGAALVLLALLAGCGEAPPPAWQGYVEGEFVLLASPYAGQLQKLHVRRGAAVEAGKPVFALESQSEQAARLEAEQRVKSAQARLQNLEEAARTPQIQASRAELAQARAALELSSTQLAQQQKLFREGFNSRARLDEARSAHARDLARVRAAEAQLDNVRQPVGREAERKAAESEVAAARAALAQAAWKLEQKSVAAPAAGRVQDTYFVEGEWVPAGRPVVSLLPPGNVKVRFYVPEALVGGLRIDQPVQVRCDGCPSPVAAKVVFVSTQAEYTPPVLYSKESRTKLVFLVEARPEAGAGLHPGQPVDVILK
jgi:HlyD family secretion protein